MISLDTQESLDRDERISVIKAELERAKINLQNEQDNQTKLQQLTLQVSQAEAEGIEANKYDCQLLQEDWQ